MANDGYSGYPEQSFGVGMGDLWDDWFGDEEPAAPATESHYVTRDPIDFYRGDAAPAPVATGGPVYSGGTAASGRVKVTTNDAPPDGDLRIRSGPSVSYGAIGGADKDAVLERIATQGGWTQVRSLGGTRNGPVTGWASSAFLRDTTEPLTTPGAIPSPQVVELDEVAPLDDPKKKIAIGVGIAAALVGGYFLLK